MSKSACDKAIEILRLTSDGDLLGAHDLKLVEIAANGLLNDAGMAAFAKLHEAVIAGRYKRPWFHGIEHLIIDHYGSVYWKGYRVERYNVPWAYSSEAKEEARELERRCKILESKGIPLDTKSVVWNWGEQSKEVV